MRPKRFDEHRIERLQAVIEMALADLGVTDGSDYARSCRRALATVLSEMRRKDGKRLDPSEPHTRPEACAGHAENAPDLNLGSA